MRLHDGRIAGIVMEKANGCNVDKTLMDPQYVYSSNARIAFKAECRSSTFTR